MTTAKVPKLSRNEHRESKRQDHEKANEARHRASRAKRIVQWSLGLAIASGTAFGLIWLASRGGELGQAFASQGQEHIAVGATHLPYNSNPPTSGPHYLQPAAWGIYRIELPDEALVHNLEHGGIWISYNNIDQTTRLKIETLAKEYPEKLIVTLRAKDVAKIVLASWRRLLKLDRFDEDTVISFIKANKNKAPEPTAM